MRAAFFTLAALALAPAWAAEPQKPAPPPIPTDAECKALPAPNKALTYGPGELLTFDIDALGAKAGTMTMRVLPMKNGALPVEAHVETNTFFSKVRRVKGTGTSWLNPKTLQPMRYLEDAQENDVHRVADVTFSAKDRSVKLMSKVNDKTESVGFTFSRDIVDVAGAIHMLRQMPFKKDSTVCFDAYGIRRLWRVWGKIEGREHVSLPFGEFDAWHLAGVAARLDAPHLRREIHVWLTDDDKRLPLAAMGSIDLGAVRATLTSFSRPDSKKAKAEARNMKW